MSQQDQLPWRKLPEEFAHWFDRFDRYARPLGHEFTVRRAYWAYLEANPDKVDIDAFDLWVEMAHKYNWLERAKAWSDFDREQAINKWKARRMQLLEADWVSGSTLRTVAGQFIEQMEVLKEVTHTSNVDEETGVVTETIVLAPNFNAGDLARLIKIGSDLQRLGIGEPTVIQATGQAASPQIYLPAQQAVGTGVDDNDGQSDGNSED